MTHVREHRSILAAAEKRLLIFIAARLPRAIKSDHLTALALASMALAGAAFAAGRRGPSGVLEGDHSAAVDLRGRERAGELVALEGDAAGDAVMDDDGLGPEGVATDRIERAERAKRSGSVGTELNPCAHLLGEMKAFEDFTSHPLPRERNGRGQSADAAACDERLPLHG